MPTFVFFHEPGPDWLEGVVYPEQPGMAHVAFARRLMDEGLLLIGGPPTQMRVRVNVRCVTPLGDDVASIS